MVTPARQTNSRVDADGRRETPLALKLRRQIETTGPISVEDYVHACLYDPEHGYYVSKPAIGQSSDFVTAPEISQVFGEVIGIWIILTWQQLGSPTAINLIELGPGRGTMMADALRSIAKVPELEAALSIHLVDTNHVLRETQSHSLLNVAPLLHHHSSLRQLAESQSGTSVPSIVLANEFLDALGVRQLIAHDGAWCTRMVECDDDGRLAFAIGQPIAPLNDAAVADGTIREDNPAVEKILAPALTTLARTAPVAGLFIDYGHTETTIGETLQAMRFHAYEHPLTSPGEADLTAHVDFADFTDRLASKGFAVDGPIAQAEFLGRLGIVERTSQLMARNPDQAATLEAGTLRLLAPNGMGTRFKAVGLRNWTGGPLTGFQDGASDSARQSKP